MENLTTFKTRSPLIFVVALMVFTFISVLAVLACFSLEMRSDSFRVAAVLTTCGAIAFIAPVLTAALHRPYNIFHPLNFIALSFFFGVFGRIFFLLFSDSPLVSDLLLDRSIDSILPGAILSMIGSGLVCFSYSMVRKITFSFPRVNQQFSRFKEHRFYLLCPLIFVLSCVGLYFFLKATEFEYTGLDRISAKRRVLIDGVESGSGPWRLLAQDLPRATLLILLGLWSTSVRRSIPLLFGIFSFGSLAIALPFLASSRADVIFVILTACVLVNRTNGIRLEVLAFAFLISLVALFGMLSLRRVNQRGMSLSESFSELNLEPFFGNRSFADVTKLSHIYDSVPGLIDYKYGKSFLTIVYTPIPRALWPSKPPVRMGREITEKIYNRGLDLKERGGGTPPGILAEAIINFGLIGFPFVLLAVGAGLALVDNSLSRMATLSVPGLALYSAVIPTLCLSIMAGDLTGALIDCLSMSFIFLVLSLLTRLKFV